MNFGEARQFETGVLGRDIGGGCFVLLVFIDFFFYSGDIFTCFFYYLGLFIYKINRVLIEPFKNLIKLFQSRKYKIHSFENF